MKIISTCSTQALYRAITVSTEYKLKDRKTWVFFKDVRQGKGISGKGGEISIKSVD